MSKNRKTAFLGSKLLGLNILREILGHSINKFDCVIVLDDREDSRSCFTSYLDYLNLIIELNRIKIDIFTIKNNADLKEVLKKQEIDITLVCGYYRLLGKEMLDLCQDGFYGIHNSLLPKYRGGSPLVWSIINGDVTVGSTLFQLTEGIDDGNILQQWKVINNQVDPINLILDSLESQILKDISNRWDEIVTKKTLPVIQNDKEATFCAQRINGDGKIDWKLDAQKINNFIRAQSTPYPGSYLSYNGINIIVMSSEIFGKPFHCSPGQVLRIEETRVLIGCGFDSALYISNLCEQSYVPIKIRDVFNSLRNRLSLS